MFFKMGMMKGCHLITFERDDQGLPCLGGP
jgi:hypothetical protein